MKPHKGTFEIKEVPKRPNHKLILLKKIKCECMIIRTPNQFKCGLFNLCLKEKKLKSKKKTEVKKNRRRYPPALQIQSTYPVNSFSKRWDSFNAMKPALDSTLSFSLANSLQVAL